MAQPLETRIASALRPSSRLKDVENVIGEVEAEIERFTLAEKAEATKSVDPRVTTEQARASRNTAADHLHDARRMTATFELLRERRQAILDDEEYAKRAQNYADAKARRDALADRISTRYPALVAELYQMVEAIDQSDAECKRVNADRPRGAEYLASAEGIARGCGDNFSDRGERFNRLKQMQVPFLDGPGLLLPEPDWGNSQKPTWERARDHLLATASKTQDETKLAA